MKKLVLALAVLLASTLGAIAQTAPTRPNGDDTNAVATTAFVQNAFAGGSTLHLPNNEFFIGNASNLAAAIALSGDCTSSNTGVITCTKTNGVAFGNLATQSGPTGVANNCLQANASGVISGTGAACGSGSGAVNTVTNSDGTLTISPTTGSVVASITSTMASSAGGFSVLSTAHSCAAADPTGGTDSTTAIQCHINYMYTTYGGGSVFIPCGSYLISGGATGLLVKGGVALHGGGMACTNIEVATDSNVITFDASTCSRGAGLFDAFVLGYHNAATATDAVIVGSNCNPIVRDDYIWYGTVAFNTSGIDGVIQNVFACGYAYCIASNGANWYDRVKMDSIGFSPTNYAFEQVTNATGMENHFNNSDFSCGCNGSVVIADGHNNSITGISNSVMDSSIGITNARTVQFINDEFGSTAFTISAGITQVTNNIFFASTNIGGGGTLKCGSGSNINLTNAGC